MNTALEAIANAITEHLEANGFHICNHSHSVFNGYSYWRDITLEPMSDAYRIRRTEWHTIHISADTADLYDCSTIRNSTVSHYHFADPNFLDALTQHIRDWLHN